MSFKRYTGSAWVDIESVRRYDGSAWVDCGSVKRYTGSAWAEVWPAGTDLPGMVVGTKIRTSINGVDHNWIVVHQGLPSSLYDSSCDGTWLLLENIYVNRAWHTTAEYIPYHQSSINTWLGGTFLGLLPAGMQSLIKTVKIPYQATAGSTTISSGANGMSTKVFLLSPNELGVTNSTATNYEDGAKLDYFLSGITSDARAKRVAALNGVAGGWWHRTNDIENEDDVLYAFLTSSNGASAAGLVTRSDHGVRPAVILDSTARVSAAPNDDGSYNLIV